MYEPLTQHCRKKAFLLKFVDIPDSPVFLKILLRYPVLANEKELENIKKKQLRKK